VTQFEPGAPPGPGEAHFLRRLEGCARCHGDGHDDLLFEPLEHSLRAGATTLTHWARCPDNGEPILLAFDPPEPEWEHGVRVTSPGVDAALLLPCLSEAAARAQAAAIDNDDAPSRAEVVRRPVGEWEAAP
jgi:hypothetical protein